MEIYILTSLIPILLVMDLLFLSIAGGVTMRPYRFLSSLKISVVFMVVQSLAAVLAVFIAQLLHPLIHSFAETTGSVLLVFVAVKMMTDARKVKNEERTFVVEDQQILMALSLASSFNILLAFLGLGLLGIAYSPSIYVLLGAIFIISQFGIFVGSHYQPIRLGRFSKFAAGLLILVLTVIYYFS